MQRIEKYWKQGSINLPVWLNGWVLVYELSGCDSNTVAVT